MPPRAGMGWRQTSRSRPARNWAVGILLCEWWLATDVLMPTRPSDGVMPPATSSLVVPFLRGDGLAAEVLIAFGAEMGYRATAHASRTELGWLILSCERWASGRRDRVDWRPCRPVWADVWRRLWADILIPPRAGLSFRLGHVTD